MENNKNKVVEHNERKKTKGQKENMKNVEHAKLVAPFIERPIGRIFTYNNHLQNLEKDQILRF